MEGKYEEQLNALRAQFPGWQFRAIPDGGNEPWRVVWCADLNVHASRESPEELAEAVRAAHSPPPCGSAPLAPLRSYAARIRRLREHEAAMREYELAATAEWERRKAGQAARLEAVTADPVAGFYLRYGGHAGQEAQEPAQSAPAETGDEEDGPA